MSLRKMRHRSAREGLAMRALGAVSYQPRLRMARISAMRDQALETISQGVLVCIPHDPDNLIVYVNPAFERLTGYSASEVTGLDCGLLQGPGTDRDEVARL